jgi:hypothetical protein
VATKNIFSMMLNQKPASAPVLKDNGFKVNKPAGTKNFAYLNGTNAKSSISKFDPDLSSSVWSRAKTLKVKGPKNG